jgi:DNA-binding CsgD family transcriptional regulator
MKKRWTQTEEQYLKDVWGTVSLAEIMKSLGRTEDSVMRKAHRLDLDTGKSDEDMMKKRWSREEDNFITENYKSIDVEAISQQLGRTVSAVRKRASALGLAERTNRWSNEEMEFLNDKWGILNLDTIAKKLNRSRNSVLLKAHKMSLRDQVAANGIFLTPNDVSSILGINIRTLYSWIWNGNIGYRKFKVGKKRKYQIAVEDLCEFIKNNQNKWNSQNADIIQIKSYYSSYFISKSNNVKIRGEMPKWIADKIERDKAGFRQHLKPWTTQEELELLSMAEQKYTYKEICANLNRSVESVKTKLYLLYKQRNQQDHICIDSTNNYLQV